MTMPTKADAIDMIREAFFDDPFDTIRISGRSAIEVFLSGISADEAQEKADRWTAARGITEGVVARPDTIDLPGGGTTDACVLLISLRGDA